MLRLLRREHSVGMTSLGRGWLGSPCQSLFAALALSQTHGAQVGFGKQSKMAGPVFDYNLWNAHNMLGAR